jgi:hypothetical protein
MSEVPAAVAYLEAGRAREGRDRDRMSPREAGRTVRSLAPLPPLRERASWALPE